jgi:hypothetical protein
MPDNVRSARGPADAVNARPQRPRPPASQDCDDCECLTKRPGWGCLLITAVVAVLLFAFSWDVLEPTEWGIVQNGLTGYVELDPDQVSFPARGRTRPVDVGASSRRSRASPMIGACPRVPPRRRCTRAAATSFGCVTPSSSSRATWSISSFPTLVRAAKPLLTLAPTHAAPPAAPWLLAPPIHPCPGGEADENPIAARTGPDPDDKESGGQPIRLSVAFQYAIDRRDVPRIYQTFGPLHKASYLRFAKQAITNEAQQFTPRAFWLQRAQVRPTHPHPPAYTQKPLPFPRLPRPFPCLFPRLPCPFPRLSFWLPKRGLRRCAVARMLPGGPATVSLQKGSPAQMRKPGPKVAALAHMSKPKFGGPRSPTRPLLPPPAGVSMPLKTGKP